MAIADCIPYDGKLNADGYGQFRRDGAVWFAHRWAWAQERGPIEHGMCIDHTCRNRACVNVAHLRVVTRGVNSTENSVGITALNKVKTHCKQGHEFTACNTYEYRGHRMCRTCVRDNHLRHRARPDVKAKRAAAARAQRRAVSSQ